MNEHDRPRFRAKGLAGWQYRVHGLKHWGADPTPENIWCGATSPDEHDYYLEPEHKLFTRPNCTAYAEDITCSHCLRAIQNEALAKRVADDVREAFSESPVDSAWDQREYMFGRSK